MAIEPSTICPECGGLIPVFSEETIQPIISDGKDYTTGELFLITGFIWHPFPGTQSRCPGSYQVIEKTQVHK